MTFDHVGLSDAVHFFATLRSRRPSAINFDDENKSNSDDTKNADSPSLPDIADSDCAFWHRDQSQYFESAHHNLLGVDMLILSILSFPYLHCLHHLIRIDGIPFNEFNH